MRRFTLYRLILLVLCFLSVSCVAKSQPASGPSLVPRDIDFPDDEELEDDDLPEAGEDDTGEG